MGQAKQRGNFELRKSLAIKRNELLKQEIEKEPNKLQREALQSYASRRGIQRLATLLVSMNALHLPK